MVYKETDAVPQSELKNKNVTVIKEETLVMENVSAEQAFAAMEHDGIKNVNKSKFVEDTPTFEEKNTVPEVQPYVIESSEGLSLVADKNNDPDLSHQQTSNFVTDTPTTIINDQLGQNTNLTTLDLSRLGFVPSRLSSLPFSFILEEIEGDTEEESRFVEPLSVRQGRQFVFENVASQNPRDIIFGTEFNDDLSASLAGSSIFARGGDDLLRSNIGDDVLDGEGGIDSADYQSAISSVTVDLNIQNVAQDTFGGGVDTLIDIENVFGSNFNDVLIGDANANIMLGLNGEDNLTGGAGDDQISGGFDDDILNGDGGVDSLTGDGGNDTLNGGDDDDILEGGSGDDIINGGNGIDRASFSGASSAVTVDLNIQGVAQNTLGAGLDTLTSIENLFGSSFDDTLTGDNSNNEIRGLDGIDLITGGDGNDSLFGGNGNDQIFGDDGVDLIFGENGNDTLNGGNGGDTIFGGNGDDTINAGLGNDNVSGGIGNDNLYGEDGDDVLFGDDGDDLLDGGIGDNTINYILASSAVTVDLNTQGVAQNTIGAGFDTLVDINNLRGTNFNDVLFGNTGDNYLDGGNGNDTLNGGDGNDDLVGGAGNDLFILDQLTGVDVIQDFSVAQNDIIDISQILTGYDPLFDALSDFAQIVDDGANARLEVDFDGLANGVSFVNVATLIGGAGLDASTLETNGNLDTVI